MRVRSLDGMAWMRAPELRDGLLAGGAPRMWEQIFRETLPSIRSAVPAGSRVLEIGYGDGHLSCWLATKLGWKIVGLDVRPEAQEAASREAHRFGLRGSIDFRLCKPEETREHRGTYDAVFAKTVLYSAANANEYGAWLDWIWGVLRPAGVLVNFETGRANSVVQAYRRLRGREYADLCLYTEREEALYDHRFDPIFRRYYGGGSQFFAPVPVVYETVARLESLVSPRRAGNCFAVAIVARRKERPADVAPTCDGERSFPIR